MNDETKTQQRIAELRKKQTELNADAGKIMSTDWHRERLLALADIERQLRELGQES